MKKGLILLIISVLLITGCSNDAKKENTKVDNKSNKVTQEVEKTKENTESKEEITKEEITKEENTKEETSTIHQQVNNTPSETAENIRTETQVPACTPKKFDNTYSYVYSTQDECKTGGNLAFMDITEDGTSDIFAYGCREIVDECGTTYYGVIFYNAPDSIVYR